MGAELSKTPIRQIAHVRELFLNRAVRESLEAVATGHLGPERLLRVAMGACQTTPDLLNCTPMSFLRGLMTCAKLGLEPNNEFGHVYLIPFRNNRAGVTECQLIPGYKGFMELALRHPAVVAIHADVVYSDDELWSYEYGSDMHLRHRPGPREGSRTHAYCYVRLKDGQAFSVLPWAEVERRKKLSQGYQRAERTGRRDSPWHTHEDRMARKTPIREMASGGELPMATEMMDLLLAEEGKLPAFELDARGQMVEGVAREEEPGEDGAEEGGLVEARQDDGPPAGRAPAARTAPRPPRGQPQPPQGRAAPPAGGAKPGAPAPKGGTPQQDHREAGEEIDPDTGWPAVIAGTMQRILGELEDARTEADIAAVEDLWGGEIASIRETFEGPGQELAEALDAARERITGEGRG